MPVVAISQSKSLKTNLSEVIEAVGSLERARGKKVLIKPNVNSNDPYPATTNPQTLALLIEYLKSLNPHSVTVGDASNASYLPTVESMRQLGLYQASTDEAAKVIGFEDFAWEQIRIPEASNWRTLTRSSVFRDFDFIINLFNVKTHFLANYSMALKNWMGTVSHRSRISMHLSRRPVFWSMIAEISLARKADFFIGDGMKCMVTGGPFSGEIKEADIIFASNEPVDMDVVGLSILKMLGTTLAIEEKSVWQQPVLKRAVELGLGARTPSEIELVCKDPNLASNLRYFIEEREVKAA